MVDRTAGPSHGDPDAVTPPSGRHETDEAVETSTGTGLPPVDLLAAEQAASDYWRQVAIQRRAEAARVQRRPIVRAAIALDRRTRQLQAGAADVIDEVAAEGRRARVVAAGLGRRPWISRRRRRLADAVDVGPLRTTGADRSMLVLHLGEAPPVGSVAATVEPVRVGPSTEGQASTGGDDAGLLERIDQRVHQSTADLICLVGPNVRPLRADWLAPLISAVSGDVVAAAPLVVRDAADWRSATSVDLLVSAAGLDIDHDPQRGPVPVARLVGSSPDPSATPQEAVAVTSAAVVIDRRAWAAAGGLGNRRWGGPDLHPTDPGSPAVGGGPEGGGTGDFDEALVDLGLRLRADGGRTLVVPAAVVAERRPVHDRRQLREPIDVESHAWRRLVEVRGPALARAARRLVDPGDRGRPTVALSTATPSRKLAPWSGDWHYADDLAGALGRAGYEVRVQSAEEVDSLDGRSCDLHLVLRGLEPVRRTSGQRHVLWVISHPEAITVDECDRADLVLVASARFAAHLASRTSTPVEVLWQATEPRRLGPRPPSEQHRHPVTVVANTRGVPRRAVTDALAAGLEPAIYGQGWVGQVDPRLVVADHVDADELAVVYSSAGVVLNDHWETMARWGFVSNRIFDVLACGTPVVSDHLAEIAELFGDLVPTWRTPAELRSITDRLADDGAAAQAMAEAGRDLVLDRHTFDHRVVELESILHRHGLALRNPTVASDLR